MESRHGPSLHYGSRSPPTKRLWQISLPEQRWWTWREGGSCYNNGVCSILAYFYKAMKGGFVREGTVQGGAIVT